MDFTGYSETFRVIFVFIYRIIKMYQIPVKNLTKLRRPRKRVKSILCDIGKQQCQDLMEVDYCSNDVLFIPMICWMNDFDWLTDVDVD